MRLTCEPQRLSGPLLLGLTCVLMLFACSGALYEAESKDQASQIDWDLSAHLDQLRVHSCPLAQAYIAPDPLPLNLSKLATDSYDKKRFQSQGLAFVAIWHVQARDRQFGGLSGLAVQPSGDLLAISDAGAFIGMGISPQTGTPDGRGTLTPMRDNDGKPLSGKYRSDSEGLTIDQGLALVSFERKHRIEAFDLTQCGAAARAVLVSPLPSRLEGERLAENRGAEALFMKQGRLHLGFEQKVRGETLIARLSEPESLDIIDRYQLPLPYMLTGADHDARTGLSAYLYRWYVPGLGNRLILQLISPQRSRLLKLEAPWPVDNFEGVAIGRSPAGAVRIWLISDDNFNRQSQRTLLLALDLMD